jgi:hypothetical protein
MLHLFGLLPTAHSLGVDFAASQCTFARRPRRKVPGAILAAWIADKDRTTEDTTLALKGFRVASKDDYKGF